jgi:5-methylcytosine-specific restriction endonuclease McrA
MRSDGVIIPKKIVYYPPPRAAPAKVSTNLFWNASSGTVKLSEGRCRMCQRPRSVRPLTRHHLVPLRWFLTPEGRRYRLVRNSNANIIPLCRACHDLIEKRDPIARRMLRRLMTQQEVAFAVKLCGIGWLEREYPLEKDHDDDYNNESNDSEQESSLGGDGGSVATVGTSRVPGK